MNIENREQQLDQLLNGVYTMCSKRDDCKGCPFFVSECSFGEPKPATWFAESKSETSVTPIVEKPKEKEIAEQQPEEIKAEAAEQPVEVIPQKEEKDTTNGTWIVSTTMGGVFTKYVFICSKCGYKKESILSIPPMSFCPECEKKKVEQA